MGIVEEVMSGFYSGTLLCEQLQNSRSDSLYWLSMVYGEKWQLRAWNHFEDSIRSARSGMTRAFGTDVWSYLDQHPDSAELYNKEFTRLLRTSGYELQHVISTPTPASIIEARPA